jgi:hypothetical protein
MLGVVEEQKANSVGKLPKKFSCAPRNGTVSAAGPNVEAEMSCGDIGWPFEYEPVDQLWAREAIDKGYGPPLARYLREADDIDPRIIRALVEMLRPASSHLWRLHRQYRSRGKPKKGVAKYERITTASLARRISKTMTIDAKTRRELADMLDPNSHHPLYLEFRHRKRGKPPRSRWASDIPIYQVFAIRRGEKSGHKLHSVDVELQNELKISRSTIYRRRKKLGLSRKPKQPEPVKPTKW